MDLQGDIRFFYGSMTLFPTGGDMKFFRIGTQLAKGFGLEFVDPHLLQALFHFGIGFGKAGGTQASVPEFYGVIVIDDADL